MACGRLEVIHGNLVDVEDLEIRRELEIRHASLLHRYKLEHLDISVLRGSCRELTQAISQDLYRRGAAGLLYRSNVDNHRCFALFEGRARLEDMGKAIPLAQLPELGRVLEKLGLFRIPRF
jgi:hypothetical protein